MAQKSTQAEKLQAQQDVIRDRVMELLEWDLMTYCMFKYECGLLYLETYLKGDAESIRLLEQRAAYWGWWKIHWMMREKAWLSACEEALSGNYTKVLVGDTEHMRACYRALHLVEDLVPVLEDSYSADLVPSLNRSW